MNLHLRTVSIMVALTLLTGATEQFNSVAQTGSYKVEVKKEVTKEDIWFIKDLESKLSKKEQKYIYETANEFKIPYELVLSVIKVESNFDKNCVSETNDISLMQVNVWWEEHLTKEFGYKVDLKDFKTNIRSGCYILGQNFKDWKKYEKIDSEKWYYLSVNSYNAGTRNIHKNYVSRSKNIKNREYGQLVMDTYKQFLNGYWDFEPRN